MKKMPQWRCLVFQPQHNRYLAVFCVFSSFVVLQGTTILVEAVPFTTCLKWLEGGVSSDRSAWYYSSCDRRQDDHVSSWILIIQGHLNDHDLPNDHDAMIQRYPDLQIAATRCSSRMWRFSEDTPPLNLQYLNIFLRVVCRLPPSWSMFKLQAGNQYFELTQIQTHLEAPSPDKTSWLHWGKSTYHEISYSPGPSEKCDGSIQSCVPNKFSWLALECIDIDCMWPFQRSWYYIDDLPSN